MIVSSEEFGCAYTVCTEGELFYAPIHENGDVSVMEFDFVDFDTMDEETAEKVERIHSALIDMMTRAEIVLPPTRGTLLKVAQGWFPRRPYAL